MFNGVTILITIISLIAVAIVWRIEYERQEMRRDYCKHCNERIAHIDGAWATYGLLSRYQTFGNPHHCTQHTEGHEPR